jgi:hypothetical protein
MTTTYPGIDYSYGQANVNEKTGIHYGIIPLHSLAHWVLDEFEPQYGEPHCPHCGEELTEEHETDCDIYTCPCGEETEAEFCYPDDPLCHVYEGEGYSLYLDEHNDVWVFDSPFYTRAQFCSPCAPGAGHLSNPCETGPKTYALGPDWFEDEATPYPLSKVTS